MCARRALGKDSSHGGTSLAPTIIHATTYLPSYPPCAFSWMSKPLYFLTPQENWIFKTVFVGKDCSSSDIVHESECHPASLKQTAHIIMIITYVVSYMLTIFSSFRRSWWIMSINYKIWSYIICLRALLTIAYVKGSHWTCIITCQIIPGIEKMYRYQKMFILFIYLMG